MKQGSSPGGDAVAHERGHLLGLDPVEQSVEGRHETWVLEPNGDAVAHEHDHWLGREPVEQSVEDRDEAWVLELHGDASAHERDNWPVLIQPHRHGSTPDRDRVRPQNAELLFQQLDRQKTLSLSILNRNAIAHERDQVRPHGAQLLFQSLERREEALISSLTATELLMNVTKFMPMMPNICSSLWGVMKKR